MPQKPSSAYIPFQEISLPTQMLYPFLKTNTLLLSFKARNMTMRVRRPLKGTLSFCIHSGSLCVLVGAFNPFSFKVVTDNMILLPFTLLFWVQIYTPFLCFLSREYPLVFVGELVWWCRILSAFACLKSF